MREAEITDPEGEPWNRYTKAAGKLTVEFTVMKRARGHMFGGTD